MDRTLAPSRPALILAVVLGSILALVPLTTLAAGININTWPREHGRPHSRGALRASS
jgi:hypothetical protein